MEVVEIWQGLQTLPLHLLLVYTHTHTHTMAELRTAATWWAGPDLPEPVPTYDLGVVGEGFGFARLVVGLPLQLDEHGGGLLQVLVPVLGGLEDDGELVRGRSERY